jgi:DNA-binding GntR family transcriptional regulator
MAAAGQDSGMLLTVPAEPTQAEMLYGRLKQKLMTGVYLPGDKLSIRRLSEETGAGQAAVREALKRLASERVLSSLAKRSYIVPVLDAKRAADLFNLRALLECEAAVQALEHIDAAAIAALDATIPKTRTAITQRRFDLYMVENHRFHFLIYQLCGNPDMIAVIEQLWMQTGPSLRQGLDSSQPDSSWGDAHELLVLALAEGDAAALRARLLRDIRWDWLDHSG